MKKTAVGAILLVGLLSVLIPSPAKAAVSVSISFFQTELAPYGEWVTVSRYGYCWHPRVHRHWRPYYNGEWVWTDYGWTWVSYDTWGDYPYHYGTWVYVDDNYGWCWEPGYVWSPAWVTWSYTDSYIGWAPVPASFAIGVTGYVGSPVVAAPSSYVFVPMSGFVGTNVSTVAVAPTQNATFLREGRNVTNFSVSGGVVHAAGPPLSAVERASGKTIRQMSLASISGHAIKPAAIAGAGLVAGKKMSVTAPASDRAAAARMAKAGGGGGPKGMAGPAGGPRATAGGGGPRGMKPSMAEAKPSKGFAKPGKAEARPMASAKAPKGFAKPSKAEGRAPKSASAKPPKGFAKEANPSKAAHGGPPSARSMKSAPPPKHAERMAAPSHAAPSHQAAPRAAERHAAPPPETRIAHAGPAPRMAAPGRSGPPQHAAGPPPHQAGPPQHAAGPPPHAGPPPQAAKGGGGGPPPKKEKGGK